MRYKNISGQALSIMVVQNRKKDVIVVPNEHEFESERETYHIKNMIAQKLLKKIEDVEK